MAKKSKGRGRSKKDKGKRPSSPRSSSKPVRRASVPANVPSPSQPSIGPHRRRPIYNFEKKHFLLLTELQRLFPDRSPILDFNRLPPGVESIETASLQLLESLRGDFEYQVFLSFCELNSRRALDLVTGRLDEEALPLPPGEVLAECYARVFHILTGRPVRGWNAEAVEALRFGSSKCGGVYYALAALIEEVIREQHDQLRRFSIPLPGVPVPKLQPPSDWVESVRNSILVRKVRLPARSLEHWAVHAFLTLETTLRRVVYQRDHQSLDFGEIGRSIGKPSLEAARLYKEGHAQMREVILSLIARFSGTPDSASGDHRSSAEEREGEDDAQD